MHDWSTVNRPDRRPFVAWLAVFYSSWLAILITGSNLEAALANWPIALAMTFGSYIAGSTPMGGGSVGFPVLVLWFDQPPTLGRDFSFAVQSIGMTSAGIYILCSRQRVAWQMLLPAMIGSAIGTPLGLHFVAPHVPGDWIKVVFAVVWASFGILTLHRLRQFTAAHGIAAGYHRLDRIVGLVLGVGGGLFVASVTGVGVDMLIYTALVLVRRADLKIAIPTSVILMAFTSLVGISTQASRGDVRPGVFENWLAAAPIVALGAPLGALVVARVGRAPTLLLVAVLCLFQFVWTFYDNWSQLGWLGLLAGACGLAAFQIFFQLLFRVGRWLEDQPAY